MNVHLPPDAIVERLVAQYATGALGSGMNVLMACLLTMRPELRREYEQMTALQGAFLDDADQIEMSANSLEQILGQLSEEDVQPEAPTPADINADLPSPLRAILSNQIENIRWRFLYPGVRQARLKIGGRDEDIKLLKIKPGKAAPRHTHDGLRQPWCYAVPSAMRESYLFAVMWQSPMVVSTTDLALRVMWTVIVSRSRRAL